MISTVKNFRIDNNNRSLGILSSKLLSLNLPSDLLDKLLKNQITIKYDQYSQQNLNPFIFSMSYLNTAEEIKRRMDINVEATIIELIEDYGGEFYWTYETATTLVVEDEIYISVETVFYFSDSLTKSNILETIIIPSKLYF